MANDPVYQPGDGGDYPSIGIDAAGFYETNVVGNNGQDRYEHVVLFPAWDKKLISGVPTFGRHYYDLTNPNGLPTVSVIQPVMHHGGGGGTYFVSRYGSNSVVVWATSNPMQPGSMKRAQVPLHLFHSPLDAPELGGMSKIKMTNLGTDVLKAVYRDGQLTFVTNDAANWFYDGTYETSIRLVRLWMLGGDPVIAQSMHIDRTFGKNSWDDHPADHMFYGWPAVEMNKNYNMAVVYARSGASNYPQVRYSAYFDGETDIRPSRPLKLGEAPYKPGGCYENQTLAACRWADTAGAAVDPVDDTGIWLAQQYANASSRGWDIWVARVF